VSVNVALGSATFGVFLPAYAFQNQNLKPSQTLFSRLLDVVLECERLGYDSVWLDDHLMYHNNPLLECWTTLSAIAAATNHIRLGTMVTCNGFRNPALLAKMAATVDVISGGKLEFGVGAGVQQQEHEAYGFAYPTPRQRVERLAETLEIVKALWTKPKVTFVGKHFQVANAVCEPKPLQTPHPRIIVGGSGEKYTLKVTAKYADRLDFGYQPLDLYKHKLHVLEAHCQALGRSFVSIEKSCWPTGQIILSSNQTELDHKLQKLLPKGVSREAFEKFSYVGTPGEVGAMLQPYLDLGVTHFMLFFGDLPDLGSLQLFAESIPQS
jgi:F420-dependent oxidoreductase-like protein